LLTRLYPDGGRERYGYTLNVTGATSYTNQITNVVLYAYDALNRKTNEVYLGVSTNKFAYSGAGDLLTLTDGNGDKTSWNYDFYGRVTNKLDNLSDVLFVYAYDPDNRLTNRWSAAKTNTVYKYDAVGNLTNVVYPVSPSIVLAYDPLHRLTTMVDGVGTTAYGYDGAGQLLSEDGPWPNDTVSFSYANRLRMGLSVQAPNAAAWAQSYGYDAARRLTSLSSPAGTFGYSYNDGPYNSSGYFSQSSSLVDSLALPDGADITNTFDTEARLKGTWLLNSSGSNLDSYVYTYNKGSQRTQVVRTAGDFVKYAYDNMGELKTAVGKEANGTTPRWQEQFGYAYDGAGNLNNRTNNTLLEQFNVNSLNELTTVTNGGRLTVSGSSTMPATSVTVNTSNALLYTDVSFASTNQPWGYGANTYTAIAVDAHARRSTNSVTISLAGTNSYSYDLNGNLLTDGTRNFGYDDENELIAVWQASAWSNNFVYDGKLRRRIERDYSWAGSSGWQLTNEIHFIYDGNVVVQERSAANLPQVSYTRGNDLSGSLQGAGGIGGLLARTDNTKFIVGDPLATAYYHCDGNGNVTCLMSLYQQIAAKYLYDPYGNTLAMYGALATANTYRFSSKEWSGNSGLYYYLYRFYDPNLQRWVNRDPLGDEAIVRFASLDNPTDYISLRSEGLENLFEFNHANPEFFVDKDGRQIAIAGPVIIGLLGILAYAECLASPSCRAALQQAISKVIPCPNGGPPNKPKKSCNYTCVIDDGKGGKKTVKRSVTVEADRPCPAAISGPGVTCTLDQ
jgi:RHS repeat-associated protein